MDYRLKPICAYLPSCEDSPSIPANYHNKLIICDLTCYCRLFFCCISSLYCYSREGALKQLNQLGKGQSINKSYTYKNGIILSLDGIMLDDNQLLVYYTINNPEGKLDIGEIGSMLYIKGMVNDYMMNSSQGLIDNSESQIRYIASFESPYFFEKGLSFNSGLPWDRAKVPVGYSENDLC
ncbi:MAG TPA: hypothetical protein DD791_11390 [Syntrophomonas sp.]|nr:hypothetical protein [Syntrophomonas sp.]